MYRCRYIEYIYMWVSSQCSTMKAPTKDDDVEAEEADEEQEEVVAAAFVRKERRKWAPETTNNKKKKCYNIIFYFLHTSSFLFIYLHIYLCYLLFVKDSA